MSYEYKRGVEAYPLLHRHETGAERTEFQLNDGTWTEAPNLGRYWRHGMFFHQTLLDERGEPLKPSCTCHLDDSPPVPCEWRRALSECKASAAAKNAAIYTLTAAGYTYVEGAEAWKAPLGKLRNLDVENALLEAQALLRHVEWMAANLQDGIQICPVCKGGCERMPPHILKRLKECGASMGHAPDCRLAAALRLAESGKQKI